MNDHVTLPASVQRFQPEATDYTERVHKRGSPSVAMEPFDAMGVVADGATLESAEAWTLFRATRVADARNVYQAIEGAEFSADLGRVSAAEPFGLIAGEWRHLADVDPESPGHGTVRPEAIELRCTIEQLGQTRALTLATDVAIEYDHPDAAWLSKDSARPVLTATNVAIGRGEMRMAATDGMRLAVYSIEIDSAPRTPDCRTAPPARSPAAALGIVRCTTRCAARDWSCWRGRTRPSATARRSSGGGRPERASPTRWPERTRGARSG